MLILRQQDVAKNKDMTHYLTSYGCTNVFLFGSRELLMDIMGKLCLGRQVSFSIMNLLKWVYIILVLVVKDLLFFDHSIPSLLGFFIAGPQSRMFYSSTPSQYQIYISAVQSMTWRFTSYKTPKIFASSNYCSGYEIKWI